LRYSFGTASFDSYCIPTHHISSSSTVTSQWGPYCFSRVKVGSWVVNVGYWCLLGWQHQHFNAWPCEFPWIMMDYDTPRYIRGWSQTPEVINQRLWEHVSLGKPWTLPPIGMSLGENIVDPQNRTKREGYGFHGPFSSMTNPYYITLTPSLIAI